MNANRKRKLADLTVCDGQPLEWGNRTYVMGIINLSPDSFSGDGLGKRYSGHRRAGPALSGRGSRLSGRGSGVHPPRVDSHITRAGNPAAGSLRWKPWPPWPMCPCKRGHLQGGGSRGCPGCRRRHRQRCLGTEGGIRGWLRWPPNSGRL